MLDYLNLVFGGNITAAPYPYPEQTPYYIRDGYSAQLLSWNENRCVLLSPKDSAWRLPMLKKQLQKFQGISEFPCALGLENLTSLQRRNLLENHIPFISRSQQIYLPFWGCALSEKFKAAVPIDEKMAPGTQLVFLYLYYSAEGSRTNLTQLSKAVCLSKATCTRAVNDLTASGLISVEETGNTKWIMPTFEKPEFLKKGYARLKSPVERLVYVKRKPTVSHIKGGIQALSEISMIGVKEQDGGIAVLKKECAKITADDILSKQEFEDFGGYILEAWSYDPAILAYHDRVDDISLLLSLEDNPNERIQMSLDEIREKHELPIKYEE